MLNETMRSIRPFLAGFLVVSVNLTMPAELKAEEVQTLTGLPVEQEAGIDAEFNTVSAAQETNSTQPEAGQAPDVPQPAESPPATEDEEPVLDLDISELGDVDVEASPFAPDLSSADVSGADRQITAETPAANIISGVEAGARNTTDAGTLLGQSSMNPGVYVQRRSPIIGDPRIRGYRFGQYLARADGGFWYPARLDLDSIISKVDSKIIDDVVIINGPYSALYGPGFSFIDIVTRSTPRSQSGSAWKGSTGLNYNGNGEQWNANQYMERGGENWGISFYYSQLTGSDYQDGNGRLIPSSYKSRNLNVGIGIDLSDDTTLEIRYLRQDQTDVELAGQFTDIDVLTTDGYTMNLTSKDHEWFDLLNLNAWFNHTDAKASGGRASKQALFNSVFNVNAPFPPPFGTSTLPRNSVSEFDVASSGFTLALTRGQPDELQATLGTDLRFYERSLKETLIRPPGSGGFRTGTADVVALIPQAESINPGLFAELVVPANDRLRIKTGARADWVSVSAGDGVVSRRDGSAPLDVLGPDRSNSFNLWSAYVTGEYDLTDELTANIGFALAQRPPTLTELYAMRPFESVLQQGLNRIQGFPLLDPERLRQLDVGLRAENERFRGGIRGFYSWIDDYITSQGLAVDPTSSTARITSVFVNTPEVTMAGGEAFGEMEANENVSLFGSVMYVEGRNRTLNEFLFNTSGPFGAAAPGDTAPPGSNSGAQFGRGAFNQTVSSEPLPQIPPLESRLGIRVHQAGRDPKWGSEIMVRIVDSQDRVADGSLLEGRTAGFTTYDIRGYWRPVDNLTLIFGVLNFTDKQYREHLDTRAGNQFAQPGISGYIGSEITY